MKIQRKMSFIYYLIFFLQEDDFTDSINCDCNSVCRKERQLCQSESTAVTATDAIPEIDDQGKSF